MSQSAASAAASPSALPAPQGAAFATAAAQHTAADSYNTPISSPQPAEQPSHLLLAYLNTPEAKQHYDGAILPFLTLHKELQAAKDSLDKFRAACNKQGADKPTLPASLKLAISERARLPTVEGQPDLFADEHKELQSIEADATKRTIAVLLKAKEKHIAALQGKANTQNFKERATNSYMEFLTPYARQFDELQGVGPAASLSPVPAAPSSAAPASSASSALRFPLNEARLHFQKHITSRVDSTVFELLAKQKERLERKKRQHEESVAAKERVLQGASSGQTLAALANKAAQQAIAPLQRDVHRLTEQSKRQRLQNSATAAPRAQAANSQPRQPSLSAHTKQRSPPSRTPAHPSNATTSSSARAASRASCSSPPAHTTQHATAQRTHGGSKRRQPQDAERGNKRGRDEKQHPASRARSPPPPPTAAPAAARDFTQGGARRQRPLQHAQQQRSNNSARHQRDGGRRTEQGAARQ